MSGGPFSGYSAYLDGHHYFAIDHDRTGDLNICGPKAQVSLFAVIWLGLLGSGLAYLVFFRLLGTWGATRTSMVAYLLPVYGIILGALVLSEPVDGRLIIGTALIIGGVALVNAQASWRPAFTRRQSVAKVSSER